MNTKELNKNKALKNYQKFLSLAALLCSFTFANAQTSISGIVLNEASEPLPGVTVMIEGSTEGAITSFDGEYSFSTDLTGERNLLASFVGFSTGSKTISLGNGDISINFNLFEDLIGLDAVVVTGVINQKSKLESSVSISSIGAKQIGQSVSRTTSEIFRTLPGFKSESSGGDGNTNLTARGIPISAGGSRYVQLQEDGLPVMLYGDIAFGTQDQFLRADRNIQRIEAIRGGSAATATSNGPGGIINFISKTGQEAGGSVGTTVGVDYQSYRTDFEYGAPLGNDVSFHIGGFFREGEGPRRANHTVNKGGQIKANLTKNFENGIATVFYKNLNDRTAAYMPMPIEVSGTNADPTWSSVSGFDAVSNGLQTPYFQQNFGLGPDGNARNVNVSDGIHSQSQAFGASFDFDLGDGWNIKSNTRMAVNGGRFVAPFTAEVGPTAGIVSSMVIASGDTTATGGAMPYTINRVSSGTTINDTDNGLVQRIHLFDVELENFNNLMSDFKVTKSFDGIDVTAGVFKANQNIEASWLWNSYLMEVKEDAELLNINANGRDITDQGLVAQGVPFWGDCCTGKYNTNYDVTAPYLSVAAEASENLNIDASIRYDLVSVSGLVTPSQQVANYDVNGNGVIDAPEQSVSRVNNAKAAVVDYDYNYFSYSIGANLKLSESNAIFVRASQGHVGNGERATWHQGGPYLENKAPKNSLWQGEVGYKQRLKNGAFSSTFFYATTKEEAGVEATTQAVLSNDYKSLGLELEGSYRVSGFDLRGMLTWVDAEIIDNDGNNNIGNNPRRQPGLTYSLLPSYSFKGGHAIGVSLIGQTKSYAQDDNSLVMPGYAYINAYANVGITKNLVFSLNVNNLTNTIGITESEEGSITEGQTNYLRARSITGRSVAASLFLNF